MTQWNANIKPKRNITQEVDIGGIKVGGENPIRLQSMTNTSTNDIEATARQCIVIARAGADYVRITAQSIKAAENIKHIKAFLVKENCPVPIIADIHFSPKAAMVAAKFADKVRINPGNFADTKKNTRTIYSDKEYADELFRINEVFIPFINICKQYGRSIRIGVNHGSLSDRIMSRYGDTTKGMVESAMEYLRICKSENFNKVVLSMKANNPLIMIESNRLLVKAMNAEGMNFPLHIGVTEAGEGEDGRIKSAVGIAALLADGIGDTIRVSLTEAPEYEIPVADKLRKLIDLPFAKPEEFTPETIICYPQKRQSKAVANIGGSNQPIVVADLRTQKLTTQTIESAGYKYDESKNIFSETDFSADYLFVSENAAHIILPKSTAIVFPGTNNSTQNPVCSTYEDYRKGQLSKEQTVFLEITYQELLEISKEAIADNVVLITDIGTNKYPIHAGRMIQQTLIAKKISNPLVLKLHFSESDNEQTTKAAAYIGSIIADYRADGIMLSSDSGYSEKYKQASFGILQACRLRITKPDYISCPSCGRTQFDIQKTTAEIRKKTAHLKGIKIAVMGCIVNGLGEMADADYGYIGAGKGRVNLYKNKVAIEKNIPEAKAVDKLLALIESTI